MKLAPFLFARMAAASMALTLKTSTTAMAMSTPTTTTTTTTTSSTTTSTAALQYQARISQLAASLQPRVLVPARGSGNFGEAGPAAFYVLEELPPALKQMAMSNRNGDGETRKDDGNSNITRTDLDLGPDRIAFVLDHVLTPDEADGLAACAEAVLEHNGHSRLAPGIRTPPGMRVNEAAHWYPGRTSDDATAPANRFLDTMFQRIRHLVPQEIKDNDGNILPLYPRLSEKVAQFKYSRPGLDQFQRHVDGWFPGQGASAGSSSTTTTDDNGSGPSIDEWIGVGSGFSLLIYLNDLEHDGLVGGETRLWSANGQRYVDVQPVKGRVLVFRRGSHGQAVLHAGLPVGRHRLNDDDKTQTRENDDDICNDDADGEHKKNDVTSLPTTDNVVVPKYMALVNLLYGTRTGTRPLKVT